MKLRPLALFLAALLLLPLLFSSCARPPYSAVLYNKMNTDVMLTLYSDGNEKSAAELLRDCEDILDEAERMLSRTEASAELSRVNASGEESLALSSGLAAMLRLSLSLARDTGGAFDPTAGVLAVLYDITGDAPLPPSQDALFEAMRYVDYTSLSLVGNTLTRPVGTVLDFGAIAKGYAASLLVDHLVAEGVSGGVLSLGGNVVTFGEKSDGSPFRVAVRDPDGGYLGILSLSGTQYVSTSGAYERFRVGSDGKTYHHIFDPKTGKPAEVDLASVTVIDENGARADALSTALFVMGYDAALSFWESQERDFDLILLKKDGTRFVSPSLTLENT